jgi:hypothetical protein
MAIIKYGVLVTGIRGKLGGAIFSANGSSSYVRPWYKSSNPRSLAQSEHRGRMGLMPSSWRAITQGERDDWDTFAALPAQQRTNSLGETYYCSGFNWFCIVNVRLLYAGQAIRDVFPAKARPAAPTITGFDFNDVAGVPQAEVTYGAGEFAATETIVVAAAYIPGGGRSVQYGTYPVLAAEPNPGASPFDFATEFVAQFGTPQAGARAFVRVYKQTDDGLRSSAWSDFQDYA